MSSHLGHSFPVDFKSLSVFSTLANGKLDPISFFYHVFHIGIQKAMVYSYFILMV